jgi:chaperonin cofactor prefoldin
MVTFVATIWVAGWSQNKRIDDLKDSINKRLELIEKRLERIEAKLDKMEERITSLELAKWSK